MPAHVITLIVTMLTVSAVGLVVAALLLKRAIKLLRGMNEPPLYRRTSQVDLPRGVRQFFEQQSRPLTALGFRPCGDFRVRHGLEHYARLFLDSSGEIAGELNYVDLLFFPWIRATCFFSLLENLDALETTDLAIPSQTGALTIQSKRGAAAAELLCAHREQLATPQADRRTSPAPLEKENLPLVALYLAALMHQCLQSAHDGDAGLAPKLAEIREAVAQSLPQPAA